MEIEREYYTHDIGCPQIYYPANLRGLRTCKGCAGVFDAEGKGVAITDKRFDAEYEKHKAEMAADALRSRNV